MSLNKEMLFAAYVAGQGCLVDRPDAVRESFELWCERTQALKPPEAAVKPLDLANLMRHAFMTGAGIGDLERIPDDVQQRWVTYDPEALGWYQRVTAALESSKVNFETTTNRELLKNEMQKRFDNLLRDDLLTPERAWTMLCETPDITSPEEYPDHALITFEQLRDYMERATPRQAFNPLEKAPAIESNATARKE